MLFFCCLLLVLPASCQELVFLQAIWRHGARTPTKTFPTDTNNTEDSWPQGLGQLTLLGVAQHFELGQILAGKYQQDGFLSPEYDAKQIYVRSTDKDRTLMSAYSNLAGMYRQRIPVDTLDWPQPWNPIPVHTIPRDMDPLLSECPSADEYSNNYGTSQDHSDHSEAQQKASTEYQKFFNWLSQKTGVTVNWANIGSLADILAIEKREKRPWVPWMNQTLFDQIQSMSVFASNTVFGNKFLSRLLAGPLLGEMLDHMDTKVECSESEAPDCLAMHYLKYYAYSAHDVNIFYLLGALGVKNVIEQGLPGLASCVLMELWRDGSAYFVRVLYRDSAEQQEFQPVIVQGCDGENCPLATFRKRSQSYFVSDWQKECGLSTTSVSSDKSSDGFKIATIVLGAVCGLLLMIIIIAVVLLLKRSVKVGGRSESYPM